jgi:ATP-dependent RNA helicase SUPV3L1/SUV3
VVFEHLTGPARRLPDEWMSGQFKALDHLEGDIDTLAARLARVRTLAYAANRPNWLADPAHWQGKTRALEDRLSDTLHERLMQRFVDRRASALMRGLRARGEVLAGVAADGAVTVEGHFVGRLRGARFEAERGASMLEDKALRAAAQRAVEPEVARRLGRLAAEPDDAFALQPDGAVLWQGEAAGRLSGGTPFAPRVRLLGDLGPPATRERAARRLEAFLAAEAGRRLAPLKRLNAALDEGRLKGLARGIAYRLTEAGGLLDRRAVEADLHALSQAERRALRGLGVRIGAFSIHMPALLEPSARGFATAFARERTRDWRPPHDRPSPLPSPPPPTLVLAAHGLMAIGRLAVPVEALERLDGLIRAAPRRSGGAMLAHSAFETLGWSADEAREILRALGFVQADRARPGAPTSWRRRRVRPSEAPPARPTNSPFAALAELKPAPRRRLRRTPNKARA